MSYTEIIEGHIKKLKNIKKSDDKLNQYGLIAEGIFMFLQRIKKPFIDRKFILSFFENGYFPTTTQNRHAKEIINTLLDRGDISEAVLNKTALQRRSQVLKSNDHDSFFILMKKNGYKYNDDDENGKILGWTATTSRANQGVYSYGNKSVIVLKRPYSVKGFSVNLLED